jgi:hypothetical protein
MLVTNKTTVVAIYGFVLLRQVKSRCGGIPQFLVALNGAKIVSNLLPARKAGGQYFFFPAAFSRRFKCQLTLGMMSIIRWRPWEPSTFR